MFGQKTYARSVENKFYFVKNAIKFLRSAGFFTVGRVTGNKKIFLFGLSGLTCVVSASIVTNFGYRNLKHYQHYKTSQMK